MAFEIDLERNLWRLYHDLVTGSYLPGRSICFVITHPKPREVWAADFRDRIVHHLFYNRVAREIEARFIADSSACIRGRGTLYAIERLEAKIRSASQNWTKPVHYLKCDLANFFVSIDKRVLETLLERHIGEGWWLDLARAILWHDPRADFEFKGHSSMLALVPPHKRLIEQSAHCGLPIGNLSSQFFANILLNELDQHVKHELRVRHYARYVDDFICLGESARLNEIHDDLAAWLPEMLGVRLNERKTILQPIARGVDFVGQRIEPHQRIVRRRTYRQALRRTRDAVDVFTTANSYFGLFGQASASHHDRARLANVVRQRGHSVNKSLTKTYRGSNA